MPKHETLGEEERIFLRLQQPVIPSVLALISLSIIYVSITIVFPWDPSKRPFCDMNNGDIENSDVFGGAFYLTVDYYWMVVFVPSALLFSVSFRNYRCLYSSSQALVCKGCREQLLRVKKGWSSLFGHFKPCIRHHFRSSCLVSWFDTPHTRKQLFISLILVLRDHLMGFGHFIRGDCVLPEKKSSRPVILDESDSGGRNFGLEMLEANPVQVTPDMEKRVNEGFKSWMGSSYLSSDEEEDPDNYLEVLHVTRTNSNRQRV